jgi:hypothetical protein
MGTRADFYMGRGSAAEWLGSIGFDGYPKGIDRPVLTAGTEDGFRIAVAMFLGGEDTATLPEQGWPWPWDNSSTTDYAYAFDDGRVWASCFGHAWFDPLAKDDDAEDDDAEDRHRGPQADFPDMSARKRVTYGRRSGAIFIGSQGIIEED